MKMLSAQIQKIKGVNGTSLEIPLESGIYALVGSNGCGKSTILQSMAQLIRPTNALWALRANDYNNESKVNFQCGDRKDEWYPKFNKYRNKYNWTNSIYQTYDGRQHRSNNIEINGMYEGSLFVGTRFQDSKMVDELVSAGKITNNEVVPADEYVKEQLSFILHGDKTHYSSLKRLKNRDLSQTLQLRNLPYFIDGKYGGMISQYRMSSGECLLISLLHFIHNAIVRSSLPKNVPILMLLDEIELALHPVAISRFLDLLEEIVQQNPNIIVILTTHAPEVIRRINPNNIFKLENSAGSITATNPCYPSYAIRELYVHDKYDHLILCEDELAKKIINKTINKGNLNASKLLCVLPVGGWENVLKLHDELIRNNIMGVGTQITSILDGDIGTQCSSKDEYKNIRKLFLPIPSIEKFLFNVIHEQSDKKMRKIIGDKYFQTKSLDEIVSTFNKDTSFLKKNLDKVFYRELVKELAQRKISEDSFIAELCEDIYNNLDFSTFASTLKKMVN